MNSGRGKDDDETMPDVSVVIPSYNSSIHIRKCLRALREQSTKSPFELILIDSSDDGTDQIVTKEFPEVRLFHFHEQVPVGKARNKGIEKARGEVILFLDTDCITKHDWIEQMYTAIQDYGADGVGGSVENGTPLSITGSVGFYLEFFRLLAFNGVPSRSFFLMGGNSGFRKEVLRPTRYKDVSVGDDFTYSWELAKQGKVLLFLPTVSVRHLNKTGLLKVLRYQYQLGLGACSYRQKVSPKLVRFFARLPVLTFLMPFGTMVWIGFTVLRRRSVLEFLKFLALLPLLYIANNVWAMGFYQGLRDRKSKP